MNYTNQSLEDIKKWLKEHLTEEKYLHSIGAMECAGKLAEKFNLDKEKAEIAGLLHDCAKNFSKKDMFKFVEEHKIEVLPKELEHLKTLHAPLSAYTAQNEFGVTDEEILAAIRYHTIGRKEMSDFEKVIFIADKIEPNTREPEKQEEVMSVLYSDNGLNRAMALLFQATINYLRSQNKEVDEQTIEICKYFMNS